MTEYHIPHWLTEACAVWHEPGGRAYEDCQLLSWAYKNDELFSLEQINWAFIRPRREQDRPLAYAQSSWMVQYITEVFGHDALLILLDKHRQSIHQEQAIQAAVGQDARRFMAGFFSWARDQIREWGLADQSDDPRVAAIVKEHESSGVVDRQVLIELLDAHPHHPDLLRLNAALAMKSADPASARTAVLRYQAARPVDPWSDRQLVRLALNTGRPADAIASLEQLDAQDLGSGQWAVRLAKIHRAMERYDLAADAIHRAIQRQPYHAGHRESAATIAIERGALDIALHHLQALVVIEPDRAIHRVRLAAIYQKMGRDQEAHQAAREALEIDPDAPAARFLQGN